MLYVQSAPKRSFSYLSHHYPHLYCKFSNLKDSFISIITLDVNHLVSVHGSINSGTYIRVDPVGSIQSMESRGIGILDLRILDLMTLDLRILDLMTLDLRLISALVIVI